MPTRIAVAQGCDQSRPPPRAPWHTRVIRARVRTWGRGPRDGIAVALAAWRFSSGPTWPSCWRTEPRTCSACRPTRRRSDIAPEHVRSYGARMWRAWLPVLLCLLVGAARASSSEWQPLSDDDGIVLESRQVDEAPREVRATTWTDVPVAAIMRVLWAHEEQPRFVPHLEYAAIVRDDLDERIVYQQIDIPVLRDRDLVVRARRTVDPATGVADVTTAAIADEGPPETS